MFLVIYVFPLRAVDSLGKSPYVNKSITPRVGHLSPRPSQGHILEAKRKSRHNYFPGVVLMGRARGRVWFYYFFNAVHQTTYRRSLCATIAIVHNMYSIIWSWGVEECRAPTSTLRLVSYVHIFPKRLESLCLLFMSAFWGVFMFIKMRIKRTGVGYANFCL